MSDNYSDTLHGAPPTPPADPSRPQVAKDEAGAVGRTATDAGKQVAGTAADQAAQVGQQARRQAKDLFAQARDQATDQARTGQRKAGESLSALASELHEMAGTGDRSGPASDLAKQAAERLESASSWLGEREPGDLLTEFRGLARRRPGAFLLGAAAAGLLVGRLTRGAIDANRDTDGPSAPVAPAVPPVAPQPPVTYREPQATTPSPVDPLDPGAQWTDPGHSPAHAPRPGGDHGRRVRRRDQSRRGPAVPERPAMTAPRPTGPRPVDGARHAAPLDPPPRDPLPHDDGPTGSESVGDLIGNVTRDMSTLLRQELALAKAELKQEAGKTGKAAGAFGGAGFAAWFVVLFLSLALWAGLSNLMDPGWAALIVAALWAVIAAVAFVVGRSTFRKVHPTPERTVDTLGQVPEALKGHRSSTRGDTP